MLLTLLAPSAGAASIAGTAAGTLDLTGTSDGTTDLVPIMTEATTGGVTVSASTEQLTLGGFQARKAFDDDLTTGWQSENSTYNNGVGNEWLQVDFGAGRAASLNSYSIVSNSLSTRQADPQNWTLEGSSDASSWTAYDTRAGFGFSGPNAFASFTLSAVTPALRYWRLRVTQIVGGGGNTAVRIAEASLFGALQTVSVSGTASGSLGITGTSAGAVPVFGAASGSLPLTGTSSGAVRASATASGALDLTGAGAGVVRVVGSASGLFAFTGDAAAAVAVRGAANGSINLTGAATATVSEQGTAVTVALAGRWRANSLTRVLRGTTIAGRWEAETISTKWRAA